jgi:hypothetical protein
MEKALYITEYGYLNCYNFEYKRIYFGNEFCERLIPSPDELKMILGFAQDNLLDFSLITGFITDGIMEQLEGLLETLFKIKPDSEIIINDWGLLKIVRKYQFSLALGRLLTRQKKGPQVLRILDGLPEETLEYLRSGCINRYFINFLKDRGINRIEVDNLFQGVKFENAGINISLYFPYGYITTSRFCFSNPRNRKAGNSLGIYLCRKECRNGHFILRNPDMPVPLTIKGNTVFFENKKIQLPDHGNMVDRIIYQPRIPI